MNPYPYAPVQPDPAATRSKDESDLNTLSILHYVWTALFGCGTFGMIGYFLVIAGVVASAPPPSAGHSGDQAMAAGIVVIVGIVMALFMIPLFVVHLLAGAGLKKRTRYTLILVASGLACLSVPLGTALGVWTIVTLTRPGVKALFGRA